MPAVRDQFGSHRYLSLQGWIECTRLCCQPVPGKPSETARDILSIEQLRSRLLGNFPQFPEHYDLSK